MVKNTILFLIVLSAAVVIIFSVIGRIKKSEMEFLSGHISNWSSVAIKGQNKPAILFDDQESVSYFESCFSKSTEGVSNNNNMGTNGVACEISVRDRSGNEYKAVIFVDDMSRLVAATRFGVDAGDPRYYTIPLSTPMPNKVANAINYLRK